MDSKQNIKAQLALLSVYLQAPIPDPVLLLYASELDDLGPNQLSIAIEALKRDEAVWSGRFPLPAKLRSYLTGSLEDQAIMSAKKILNMSSWVEAKEKLSNLEYCVAYEYGIKAILEREHRHTATIYAQLRDSLRSTYSQHRMDSLRIEMDMRKPLPGNLDIVKKELAKTEEFLGLPPESID